MARNMLRSTRVVSAYPAGLKMRLTPSRFLKETRVSAYQTAGWRGL